MHVDPLWQAWKDFVRNHYDWADELDDYLFDRYDEPALREIVRKHTSINQELKKGGSGSCLACASSLMTYQAQTSSMTQII